MTNRVRAVLVTPADQILTIRRQRPGLPPYWVLPGGGVDTTDASLEDALHREIREELGGEALIHSLIHVVDTADDGPQFIFLARISTWSDQDRTGPEFSDPSRGSYHLDVLPLTRDTLDSIDLKPAAAARFLRDQLAGHGSLFQLPDLRPLDAHKPN